MKRNYKKFAIISIILSLVLITGAVYAAAIGTLTFTGWVGLGEPDLDCELQITPRVLVSSTNTPIGVYVDGNFVELGPANGDIPKGPITFNERNDPFDDPNNPISSGTYVISEDGQTATFDVYLAYPGSEIIFNFGIKNTKSMDARLVSWYVLDELDPALEYTESKSLGGMYGFKGLEGTLISRGSRVENRTFGIKWKNLSADENKANEGRNIQFTLKIDYEAVPT